MKTVLVTGCSRGLGLAVSQRLVSDGYRVIGVARSRSDDYMSISGLGDAHFLPFDMENIEAIPQLVAGITTDYGGLYGLVNNAAIGLDGVLATMHHSDISRVLKVNLEATVHVTKYACRSMLVNSEGRVVTISSIIARTGFTGLSVYAASKAALEGFTRSLARELGRAGITVNCVAPGFMETEMTAGLHGDRLEAIRRRSPLGLPDVGDVAAAVAFLMSPEAARITGSTITVDGGSTA